MQEERGGWRIDQGRSPNYSPGSSLGEGERTRGNGNKVAKNLMGIIIE